VAPGDDDARRALRAIEEDRLADADRIVERMASAGDDDATWKFLVEGMIAAAKGDFARAEPRLWQSATWALLANREDPTDARRLAARALEKIGWIHRRRDRAAEAEPIHRRALQIREQHGSFEERWESTMSLGFAADLARRADDALEWFRRAVELGSKCAEQPERKQALAWNAIGVTLIEASRFDEATGACRKACDAWRTRDAGSLDTAQADAKLAHALLKRAESIHGDDPAETARLLDEAIARLTETQETLLAFGPPAAPDAHWTAEQLDFANRLRALLP
jgi:tetratricopeptide (TPR) repeat protein